MKEMSIEESKAKFFLLHKCSIKNWWLCGSRFNTGGKILSILSYGGLNTVTSKPFEGLD